MMTELHILIDESSLPLHGKFFAVFVVDGEMSEVLADLTGWGNTRLAAAIDLLNRCERYLASQESEGATR